MSGPSRRAWLMSWGLHLCLVLLLLFGPSLRPTPKVAKPIGNIIEAVLVDPSMLGVTERNLPKPVDKEKERQERIRAEKLRQQKQKERDDAAREAALIAQREEAAKQKRLQDQKDEQEREAEEKRIQEAKVAEQKRKDALAEEKKAEADAEKKRIAAEKEKERIAKEQAAKKKAEEERLAAIKKKKAAEAKAKAAAEAKRKAELAAQMKREQDERQRDMLAAMGVEEQRVDAINSGLMDQYLLEITNKVIRNWKPPATAREGLSCKVQAQQIPGGEVISAKVLECNGDDAVRHSIEAAVLKASPLPEPKDSTLFDRTIIFTFAPN